MNDHTVAHAPKIFKHIKDSENGRNPKMRDARFNLAESLDVIQNREAIKKAGKGDGGASGEFMFFSKDNKIIVKSINKKEFGVFKELLPDYY